MDLFNTTTLCFIGALVVGGDVEGVVARMVGHRPVAFGVVKANQLPVAFSF